MNLVMGLSWILTSALPFPQKKKKKKKNNVCNEFTQNEFSYGIAVHTS